MFLHANGLPHWGHCKEYNDKHIYKNQEISSTIYVTHCETYLTYFCHINHAWYLCTWSTIVMKPPLQARSAVYVPAGNAAALRVGNKHMWLCDTWWTQIFTNVLVPTQAMTAHEKIEMTGGEKRTSMANNIIPMSYFCHLQHTRQDTSSHQNSMYA